MCIKTDTYQCSTLTVASLCGIETKLAKHRPKLRVVYLQTTIQSTNTQHIEAFNRIINHSLPSNMANRALGTESATNKIYKKHHNSLIIVSITRNIPPSKVGAKMLKGA
jgi:hypothetical protein